MQSADQPSHSRQGAAVPARSAPALLAVVALACALAALAAAARLAGLGRAEAVRIRRQLALLGTRSRLRRLSRSAPGRTRPARPAGRAPARRSGQGRRRRRSAGPGRRSRRLAGGRSRCPAPRPTQDTEFTKPNKKALTPANLLTAYSLNGVDAAEHADDRRSSTPSTTSTRRRPAGLLQSVRPARVHRSQRLLSQGQPARQSLAAAGLQRRTGTRLGAGDRDRRGDRARAVPELSHPARRGRIELQRQPLRGRADGRLARRDGDLQLVGRRRAGLRQRRVQPPGRGDRRLLRRLRLSQLVLRNGARIGRLPGQLAARRRRRRHAAEPQRDDQGVGKRDRVERRRLQRRRAQGRGRGRRRLQRALRRARLAAEPRQLGVRRLRRQPRRRRRRRPTPTRTRASPIYDSTETEGNKGWATIGGTSVAAPIVASVFALAGGAHGVAYPARTLYENELLAPAVAARRDRRLQRRMPQALRKKHRHVGLHGRRRGADLLGARDLPGRRRL